MWIAAGRIDSRNPLARMTVDAEQRAVTNHAHTGLGGCLLVVDREEIRTVHRLPHGRIKSQPRWDGRNRHAMTGRTLTLSVTSRAEVALRVGLNSMLAKEVAVMDHVAFWWNALGSELYVTAIAVTHVPLSGVFVTAKARSHAGSKGGVPVADVYVASNAISDAFLGVRSMGEAQMLPGHFGPVPRTRSTVAIRARVRVVRLFVTLDATLRRRNVQWAGLPRVLDAPVAFETVDALQHVSSMLEGALLLLALALQPEDFSARAR